MAWSAGRWWWSRSVWRRDRGGSSSCCWARSSQESCRGQEEREWVLLILGSFRYFVWKEVFALRCIHAFHSFDLIHANLAEKKSVFLSSSDCTFSTVCDVYGVYNEILGVSNCETGYWSAAWPSRWQIICTTGCQTLGWWNRHEEVGRVCSLSVFARTLLGSMWGS